MLWLLWLLWLLGLLGLFLFSTAPYVLRVASSSASTRPHRLDIEQFFKFFTLVDPVCELCKSKVLHTLGNKGRFYRFFCLFLKTWKEVACTIRKLERRVGRHGIDRRRKDELHVVVPKCFHHARRRTRLARSRAVPCHETAFAGIAVDDRIDQRLWQRREHLWPLVDKDPVIFVERLVDSFKCKIMAAIGDALP
jgi:hypothetical protein